MEEIINSEVNTPDFADLSDNSVRLDPFLTTIDSIGKFYFIPELSKELIARLQLDGAGKKMNTYTYYAMENILSNLLIAHEQDKYLIINLNSNKYSYNNKRQGLKHYSYRRYKRIVEVLESEEYIQLYKGYYCQDKIKRSRKTRISPAEKLIELCKKYPPQNILWLENKWISSSGVLCGISPCARDFKKVPHKEQIILKAKEGVLSYKDTRNTKKMKRRIAEYNEMMSNCSVSIPAKVVIYRHADNEELLKLENSNVQIEQVETLSKNP